VASGMLDSGVVLLPVDEELFETYSFVNENIKVVVHPTHALASTASRQEVSLAELSGERFLLFHEDFALHNRIIDECVRVGFHPNVIYKSAQWDFLSEMVAANIGITLLPQTICSELDPKRFHVMSLVNPQIKWHLAMIWRKNSYLSYATREWIRFTKEMLP